MSLIEEDKVEEVLLELSQPSITIPLQLLNVGDDDVSVYKVGEIGRGSTNFGWLRKRRPTQNLTF